MFTPLQQQSETTTQRRPSPPPLTPLTLVRRSVAAWKHLIGPIDWHGLAAQSEPPALSNCFHVCLRADEAEVDEL